MFDWWRDWRRRRIQRKPLPAEVKTTAIQGAWQWKYAPQSIQTSMTDWMKVFVAEKNWEGCAGFQLNESHKWTIASQAALMVVAYPNWYFDNVTTFLLYPETYVAPGAVREVGGVQIVGDSMRSGEAWYHGPVILNWKDTVQAKRNENDGNQLVIHELSHQMDMVNSRSADGVPPLPASSDPEVWRSNFENEFRLASDYVAQGYSILIDDYGLTSLGEFFAVSSELYFQLPHHLAEFHPGVFDLLLEFYQRDWREWLPKEDFE